MSITHANKWSEPLILSDVKCLYCGKSSDSLSYNCSCHPRPVWQNLYRSSMVKFFYNTAGKEFIRQSVLNYSFDHKAGMRQYAGLPLRDETHPSELLTGLSPLLRLSNFSFRYGADLYVKDESYNPGHSTADREMLMCVLHCLKKGYDKAVYYGTSTGAASAAFMAAKAGISLIAVLDDHVAESSMSYIRSLGADVISISDDNGLSGAYQVCAQLNAEGVFAKAGYDNWSVANPFRLQGHKTTALEIVKQLSPGHDKMEVPDYLVIPAIQGTSIIGIWKGFQELHELGLIEKLPRLVAVGVKNASPVCKAVRLQQMNTPVRCDLRVVNDKNRSLPSDYLLAEAFDCVEAVRSVIQSGGLAVEIDTEKIRKTRGWLMADEEDLLREELSLQDDTSLFALAALEVLKDRVGLQPWHRVVSLIPGCPFSSASPLDNVEKVSVDYDSDEEGDMDTDVLSAPVYTNRGKLLEISSRSEDLEVAFRHLRT